MPDTKSKPNRVEFEVDGQTYVVVRPNRREEAAADLVYNTEFTKLFRAKNLTDDEVEDHLRDRGKWGDVEADRIKAIDAQIKARLKVAARKVPGVTKAEVRKACIDVRKLRLERLRLRSRFRQLEGMTCEAQARAQKFNHLIVVCVRDGRGQPVYKSPAEYLEKPDDDPVVAKANEAMMALLYDFDAAWFEKLPENAILRENGWADDKGRLVREDGSFCDEQGRRVDDLGRVINELGQPLDDDGDPVDDEGVPLGETFPLADGGGDVATPSTGGTTTTPVETK